MSTTQAEWLALREPADAAARAQELVEWLRPRLVPVGGELRIRDLGCGTGALGRWLARRLPGPQHWTAQDRDADALARIGPDLHGRTAADGRPVRVTPEQRDLTALTAGMLAGTSLVTASALLDVLTAPQLERVAACCTAARVPVLVALTVTGGVAFDPPHPADTAFRDAFNAHQRRRAGRHRRLGPDAAAAARIAFRRRGARVLTRPAPWRLDAGSAALAETWLRGWVDAAQRQRPSLARRAAEYVHERLSLLRAGELSVRVEHADLLVLPPGRSPRSPPSRERRAR
ncbi:class I SAM-dependent methyltransferase [Bounagaea algeriensis]